MKQDTFSYFFFFEDKYKLHTTKLKVDKTINGIEIPSTPKVNFRLSLLNQLNELTNWKCGISLLKFKGRYNESRKLLNEVQIADFLD